MNNSNISLEPRLVEYLKRKKFHEENDINTTFLEKQYQITKTDFDKINKYQKKLNVNNGREYSEKPVKNYDENSDLISFTKGKFEMSNMYDARLERINQKVKKEKDASKYKYNTTNLQKNYDMYSRDFSSTTSRDFSNEFDLDNIRDEMNSPVKQEYESNSNFNTHELVKPPSSHQYHNPPVIQRDQTQPIQRLGYSDMKINNNAKIGNGYSQTYRTPQVPYIQKGDTFDIDNKITIPANNCRKNDLNTMFNEFGNTGTSKNIDYDNYVRYGHPTSKARSLGFENASEHFFQFIDSDIQDPKHVVSDRPTSTRLDNKTVAKSKQRDVY